MHVTFSRLRRLQHLDVSSNPLTYVIRGDFKYLDGLRVLKLNDLWKCTKVERGAFSNLKNLRVFEMSGETNESKLKLSQTTV